MTKIRQSPRQSVLVRMGEVKGNNSNSTTVGEGSWATVNQNGGWGGIIITTNMKKKINHILPKGGGERRLGMSGGREARRKKGKMQQGESTQRTNP